MADQNDTTIVPTSDDKTTSAGNSPWYEGADAETIGYFQNRGLDKGDAKTAAFSASKAHREAEKLIGAPANEIVRLPKDKNDPAWRSVHQRLGVPADAKEYVFSDIKLADGSPLDADFVAFLQEHFHANNISKDAAVGFTNELAKRFSADAKEAEEASREIAKKEHDTLVANWGVNYNRNLLLAEDTAKKLGISAETIETFKALPGVGNAKVQEMFRSIGEKIGEDKFVSGGGEQITAKSVEGAKAALAELKSDKVWVSKLNEGDAATKREFNNLIEIISSGG